MRGEKVINKNIELKPCPFCGNTSIKPRPRYSELTGEVYGYTVECFAGCYAKLFHSDENKAIERWNRRS